MTILNSNNQTRTLIPTLETGRLRLREWRVSDFEAFAALKIDPDLQKYVLGGPLKPAAVWDDFCALSGIWMLRGIGAFLAADRKTDEPRGLAGFWFPLDMEIPELYWSLFPGNMGRGYATEAALAAREWIYANRSCPKLVSYIHPDNISSVRVAERLGAKPDGKIKLYGADRLVYLHPAP